jgi:hypothetical protein
MVDRQIETGGGQLKTDRPTDALGPAGDKGSTAAGGDVSQPGRTRRH